MLMGRAFRNEAVRWAKLASEQGHADSQALLGALYAEGKGGG